MKIKLNSLFLSSLILLVSCNTLETTEDIVISPFKETTSLENAVTVGLNGLGVSDLLVVDSFLLVFDRRRDHLFHWYSTHTHEHLVSFGRKGKGPNEFIEPILTPSPKKEHLLIYDMEQKMITTIDIRASLAEKKMVAQRESLAKAAPGVFIRKIIHKDQDRLHFMPEFQSRMMIYNFNNGENLSIPFIPVSKVPIKENNLWMAYHSVFSVNPSLQRIAAAPLFFSSIDFFDFQGNHLSSTYFKDYTQYGDELIKENLTKSAAQLGIVYLHSTQETIYALDQNRPYNQPSGQATNRILQFDWNGNTLHEYLLDEQISTFAYDAAQNRMYIYNPNKMDNNIAYYEMVE